MWNATRDQLRTGGAWCFCDEDIARVSALGFAFTLPRNGCSRRAAARWAIR
jgi:hypothetical protein